MRFSTGAVNTYVANGCGGPDLWYRITAAEHFENRYRGAGHTSISTWRNGDVWGSDFRDGGGDLDPNGGSELPDIYFYAGHGSCQNAPTPSSADFITVCGNFGKPNTVNIGQTSRWGNAPGQLKFLFLDASCPMDLISLGTNWFPAFQGLHIATGHSGTSTTDTLDSADRTNQFAARTVGIIFVPQQSVGDAWMSTGWIDVQSGCSAVVIAAGATESEAIDRRHNERVNDGRPNPTPNWFAWMWVTRV